jgi:hypothetical protein
VRVCVCVQNKREVGGGVQNKSEEDIYIYIYIYIYKEK